MISIPLFLVDLDFRKPIVWNGNSLELSDLSFEELNNKILNLKKNRLRLSANIQKVKLDLGQIRKFDLYDIESQIIKLENYVNDTLALIDYADSSETNIKTRITMYKNQLSTLQALYQKYKELGDPILNSIDADSAEILTINKKILKISSSVSSLNSKSSILEARLYSSNSKINSLNSSLYKINNDINTITNENLYLTKIQADLENLKSVIEIKSQQNDSNIEYLASRICEIALRFSQVSIEIDALVRDISQMYSTTDYLNKSLNSAKVGFSKLVDNVEILKDFYVYADQKVRAIETYLTAFIVGGDNVHLDFGNDYTIVHVIPPKIPPCPDPEPCAGSGSNLTPLIANTSIFESTPVSLEKSEEQILTDKILNYEIASSSETELIEVNPPKKSHCFASDSNYLGCFVVYAVKIFLNQSTEEECSNNRFNNNEVIAIECYWDVESKMEAESDAKNIANIWNTEVNKNENCYYLFKVAEIQDDEKCRLIDSTDIFES